MFFITRKIQFKNVLRSGCFLGEKFAKTLDKIWVVCYNYTATQLNKSKKVYAFTIGKSAALFRMLF